jgi:hypothetical protein
MAANPHVMRRMFDTTDIKFANGTGPLPRPTNALARTGRKKPPVAMASTLQARLLAIGRPITTPAAISGKQPLPSLSRQRISK